MPPSPGGHSREAEPVRAIAFDLDGVLVDSEPLHDRAWVATVGHFGFRFAPGEIERFRGSTDEVLATHLLGTLERPGATLGEVIAHKSRLFAGLFREIEPVEGAIEFVRHCHALGLALGLTTSALGVNQRMAFDRFGLAPYFSVVVTGEDITRAKPDPEPYRLTVSRLGVEPRSCWVVEDSLNGVRSGLAAGCRVAALTTSFPGPALAQTGAHLVVAGFAELSRQMGLSACPPHPRPNRRPAPL